MKIRLSGRHGRALVALSLLIAGPALAAPGSTDETAAPKAEGLSVLSPELLRNLFSAMAVRTAAVERLATIGLLCGSVSREDAETIYRNAREELDHYTAELRGEDRVWADTYLTAVRAGATQAGILAEDRNEDGCRRFALPGGQLMRVMTWTDKPQFSHGVRASPRMTP